MVITLRKGKHLVSISPVIISYLKHNIMLFSFFMLLCLICCSLADTHAGDQMVSYKTNVYLELLGIKQLVNQERIYRLDLERQIRELRGDGDREATGKTFTKDVLNATLMTLKESIVSEVESSIAKNIGKIFPFLSKLEHALDKVDKQMTDFSTGQDKLGEDVDVNMTSFRGMIVYCISVVEDATHQNIIKRGT